MTSAVAGRGAADHPGRQSGGGGKMGIKFHKLECSSHVLNTDLLIFVFKERMIGSVINSIAVVKILLP